MKYCTHCGNELVDDAVVCVKCGCACGDGIVNEMKKNMWTGLKIAAKIFMIIGTVFHAFFWLIPLAWCLPLTLSYFGKVDRGEKISLGFKICCLIFVSKVAGICMLCDNK